MFAIIEREYEWYEKVWYDSGLYVKEKVMDIADCDETLIEKYIKKEEGWEKIEDEYDAKHQGVLDPLIKKYGYTNDHGNKVERIIVGIGDEFIEEVY